MSDQTWAGMVAAPFWAFARWVMKIPRRPEFQPNEPDILDDPKAWAGEFQRLLRPQLEVFADECLSAKPGELVEIPSDVEFRHHGDWIEAWNRNPDSVYPGKMWFLNDY